MSGILDSTFRPISKSRIDAEPQSQDYISTKRDTSRTRMIEKFSNRERSKTFTGIENPQQDLPEQARKASKSKTAFDILPKSPNAGDRTGTEKQTMFEKRPSSKKNSLVSYITGALRRRDSIAPEAPDDSPGPKKSIVKDRAKGYGKSLISVAQEEIIEHDDWNFDFGKIEIKFPLFMINPYGRFKKLWNICSLLLLVVLLFIYSVRLCFELDLDDDFRWSISWLPFDELFDFLCLIDIIVSFLSAFENKSGILIISRKVIAINYLKGDFATDLLGLFPINPSVFQLPNVKYGLRGFSVVNYNIWRVIRLIKLIKSRKIFRQLNICIRMFKRDFALSNFVTFCIEIVIIVHISACIWNLVGEMELLDSWIDVEGDRYDPIACKYLESIYLSLTVLLTVGYGNISANNTIERGVLIVWMFLGVVAYAYIIGSLSSGFAKINKTKTSKSERELFYTNFAKIFKLPFHLLDHVLNTIGTQYSATNTAWVKVYETNKLLVELPKSLYGDICTHVYRELIETIDFFQNKPKHFLVRILPLLKPNNISFGDEVYKNGDPSTEIFFIHKGRIASVCHDRYGKIRSQIFVQGAYFGESDIIFKRARASTAYAESKVALWKLNKGEFLSILEEFPDVKKEVLALAKIKEMYRVPIVKTAESKVNELIYAKKLLAKVRNKDKNMDNKSENPIPVPLTMQKTDSEFRKSELADIFSPSLVAEKTNIFSPDFRKKIARKQKDSEDFANTLHQAPEIKDEPVEKVSDEPVEKVSDESSKKSENSLKKTVTSPMLAKALSKKKSVFFEDYLKMPNPTQSEPTNSDDKPLITRNNTTELNTYAQFQKFEEEKTVIMSRLQQRSSNLHTGKNTTEMTAQEKVKQKLFAYLNEKGVSIGDYGIIEMLMKGRDSVVSSREEFETACNKTIEEIDQYTETELRISSSFGVYSEFLTDLMDGFTKKRVEM